MQKCVRSIWHTPRILWSRIFKFFLSVFLVRMSTFYRVSRLLCSVFQTFDGGGRCLTALCLPRLLERGSFSFKLLQCSRNDKRWHSKETQAFLLNLDNFQQHSWQSIYSNSVLVSPRPRNFVQDPIEWVKTFMSARYISVSVETADYV